MTADAKTDNLLSRLTEARDQADQLVLKHLVQAHTPTVLYHYTNLEGANGIITGRKLWATNAGYMNDSSELLKGVQVFRDVAREIGLPHQFLTGLFNQLRRESYLTCFSEHGDLLSQWRAYCPNGGVALGFSPRHEANFFLKVSYDMDLVRELTRSICDLFAKAWSDTDIHDNEQYCDFWAKFADAFLPLCLRIKDQGFEEEAEWRRSVTPESSAAIKVRSRSSLLVP